MHQRISDCAFGFRLVEAQAPAGREESLGALKDRGALAGAKGTACLLRDGECHGPHVTALRPSRHIKAILGQKVGIPGIQHHPSYLIRAAACIEEAEVSVGLPPGVQKWRGVDRHEPCDTKPGGRGGRLGIEIAEPGVGEPA